MYIFLGFLVLFYTLFGAIGYWQLLHFAELVESIHDHPLKVTKGTLTVGRNVVRISRNVKDMLLVKDIAHRKLRLAEIEQDERDTEQNIALVLERMIGDHGRELVKNAMTLIDDQMKLRKRITDDIFSGKEAEAEMLARVNGTQLMKDLEESVAKITNFSDTQSMGFHVESVSDLKKAKVVLISAGLIMVILSIIFTVLAFRAFHRWLSNAGEALRTASERQIDLTVSFDSQSPGQMGNELNAFIGKLADAISAIKKQYSHLNSKLTSLHERSKQPAIMSSDVAKKLNTILQKIDALLFANSNGDRSYKLPFELLEQIKGDLSLLIQFTSTKDLLIERLKLVDDPNAKNEIISSLKAHNTSMRDNIDRTSKSVNSVAVQLNSLLSRLGELHDAHKENQTIKNDLSQLQNEINRNIDFVKELQTISQELDARIKDFKMS